MADNEEVLKTLKEMRRELSTMRELMGQVIFYVREAESEIPEKMRRFITYMHDIHDVSIMYETRGSPIPPHVLREMERCDDRYRQMLKELHGEGEAFAKVRAKMAEDPENRFDHTRQLSFRGVKRETG